MQILWCKQNFYRYEGGGVGACQGDTGGPLMCQKNTTSPFVLQGITSFGDSCANPDVPGVYTRVSKYVSWIDNQITANSGTLPVSKIS